MAEEDRAVLGGLFEGFVATEPDAGFMDECTEALKSYFKSQGVSPSASRLNTLAGKLCAKLEGEEPSRDVMQREILSLVVKEAAGL